LGSAKRYVLDHKVLTLSYTFWNLIMRESSRVNHVLFRRISFCFNMPCKNHFLESDWDMCNPKLIRGKYIWINKRINLGHIANLDYFWVHNFILKDNILISSHILSLVDLDHNPIMSTLWVGLKYKTILFHFNPL